jgi:predicted PhzF superfamily epimerase YddE/YHI9
MGLPLFIIDAFTDVAFGGNPAAVCLLDRPRVDHQRNRMDYLVELGDETAVRALTPDMRMLARLPMRGVIVTAHSNDSRFDFVSRFFAPGVGIDENPVTGSAHCCLAPYWAQKLGKTEMVGYQASTRGGVVRVSLRDNRGVLGGQAITVAQGLTTD